MSVQIVTIWPSFPISNVSLAGNDTRRDLGCGGYLQVHEMKQQDRGQDQVNNADSAIIFLINHWSVRLVRMVKLVKDVQIFQVVEVVQMVQVA